MALNKQMELFEDGGLMDEGGTVDKVSGNDVPTGSTQEEVRDDIPANLSEGEFVLPADVVRFHGLEKIMSLRDEAKAGLRKMDAMGQMGNSEEATLPDDMPFTIDDLDMEDDGVPDYQTGGYVAPTFNPGQVQQSQFADYTPQYTAYQAPDYTNQATGYQPPQQAATPMAPSTTPTFSSFVTPTYVSYVNEAGNTIQIPVDANGNPLIPVPAGFTAQGEQPTTPTPTTPTTTPTSSFTVPKPYDEGQGSRDDAADSGLPADITSTNAKAAALTMIDPRFADVMSGINNKYTSGGIKSPLIAAIDGFKKMSETKKAINDFDMDTAASGLGLSTEDLSNVIDTFGNEIFTGYRDAEGNITAESIAKGPKSSDGLVQQMKDGFSKVTGIGQTYDEGDYESGTSVSDVPTVPVTDITKTATTDITEAKKPVESTDTKVSTAQVTQGDTTVSEAAKVETTPDNILASIGLKDKANLEAFENKGGTIKVTDSGIVQTIMPGIGIRGGDVITSYSPNGTFIQQDTSATAKSTKRGKYDITKAISTNQTRQDANDRAVKATQERYFEQQGGEGDVTQPTLADSGLDYGNTQVGPTGDNPSGDSPGNYGGDSSSSTSSGGDSYSGGSSYGDSDGRAKGGLISKPKPKKTKKMKKGGLASKK